MTTTVSRRTISIKPLIDEAVSMLALENKMTYSGYIEKILYENDMIRAMIKQLERLPQYPELSEEDIELAQTKEPILNNVN